MPDALVSATVGPGNHWNHSLLTRFPTHNLTSQIAGERMAKKGIVKEATDAVKSVAGAALGAAAIAATGVVVTRVAGAIRKRRKDLADATPQLQRLAGDTVSMPLLPRPRKRAAAKRKAKSAATKKIAAKKAARKRRTNR
jgi:hypothetical protein